MKLPVRYKISLSLVIVITVAVLCALPFFMTTKQVIYVYTKSLYADSQERGFIRELKQLGYEVKVNNRNISDTRNIALWFRNPGIINNVFQSKAQYNFLYNEEYMPIDGKNVLNMPIILTPYRALYEHYVRSNMKSALFEKGVNTAEFYPYSKKKTYNLVYLGDNNKDSSLVYFLEEKKEVLFLGRFWTDIPSSRILKYKSDVEKGEIIAESRNIIIYNPENATENNKIPTDVLEATATGALVFSSPNEKISAQYGDNVIIYHTPQELWTQIIYYQNNPMKAQQKAQEAQKITLNNYSSQISAHRFKELLDWLKNTSLTKQND